MKMKRYISRAAVVVAMTAGMSACMSDTTMGGGQSGGPVSGAAGPNGSQNASAQLERCDKPLGIATLVESQDVGMTQTLQQLGLGSPTPVIKLIISQSNCFQVVDRGAAMQTIQQERQLSGAGQTRAGSNLGGGQIITPDLAITPNVLWSGQTGGAGGGLAGAVPGWGGIVASTVMGAMKESKAQVMLTATDVRSTLQLAAAEGNATSQDFSIGAALFGGGWSGAGGGAFGAYSSTPEGKTVTAALVDAYNNLVRSVRGMPPLPSVSGRHGSGGNWVANGTLVVRADPSASAEVVGQLTPGSVVQPTGGKSKDGAWVEVQMGDTRGWVKKHSIHQQ